MCRHFIYKSSCYIAVFSPYSSCRRSYRRLFSLTAAAARHIASCFLSQQLPQVISPPVSSHSSCRRSVTALSASARSRSQSFSEVGS